MANLQIQKPQMLNGFPYYLPGLRIDQSYLRYHFETCTFIQFEFIAKIGLKSALNSILSLMISQPCPNRVYSQLITIG